MPGVQNNLDSVIKEKTKFDIVIDNYIEESELSYGSKEFLNFLGQRLQQEGFLDAAIINYEKAIKIDLETIGNNHPQTKSHIRNKERCQEAKANN